MQNTSPRKDTPACKLGCSAHYDWLTAISIDPGPWFPESAGDYGKIIGHAVCEVRLSAEGWLSSGGARNVSLLSVCKYFSSRFFCLCRKSIALRDSTCSVPIYILLVGMDGASAVVALVGFVATTIQQLDKIITTLRNAQKDLSGFVEYLEQMRSSLTGAQSVVERLDGKVDQHGSLNRIQQAVEYFKKILISLEVRVSKINGSDHSFNKLKKTVTSFKYYLKKDEILEVQNQLHKAMTNLNSAISTDNSHR